MTEQSESRPNWTVQKQKRQCPNFHRSRVKR
nr:MAG TPA: hypothetical protein [Caudoviricetes sp.]